MPSSRGLNSGIEPLSPKCLLHWQAGSLLLEPPGTPLSMSTYL